MFDIIENDFQEIESQHYCNYPEVSKKSKRSVCYIDESILSASTSSSCLPSLTSAISDPVSQVKLQCHKKSSSPSLLNLLSSNLPQTGSNKLNLDRDTESTGEELCESYEESGSSEDEGISVDFFMYQKSISDNLQHLSCGIDPVGWIKYATDSDPWNPDNYFSQGYSPLPRKPADGVLTRELVSEGCCKIGQLPDSKAFVLTRLHLNRLGLGNIFVLLEFRYFQYVDLSWNFLTSITELSNLNYLMYLNASHNKLTTALNMKPPWFLTHANLSCNEITEIGPFISNFWSLRYIDLSYNLITKIDGLHDLKYLQKLYLSHNRIKKLENFHSTNLEELSIDFNELSEWDVDTGLQALKKLQILKVAHNKLSSLLPFQELTSLKKLDVSYNCITKLQEISCLADFKKFHDLNLTGNPISSEPKYREFAVFKLSRLKFLDTFSVECSEKVSAKMLFEPDLFTSVQQMRAKIELWNQLSPWLGTDTAPADQPPAPLVLLVGTFANYREELAEQMVQQFPDYIYRCKKHTTLTSVDQNITKHIQVTDDEFNTMIKEGKFLVNYTEIGVSFGICRDELCNLVVESKIGLLDITLEAALVIRASGLQPYMVLCVMDDLMKYSKRLQYIFIKLGLWGSEDYATIFSFDSAEKADINCGLKSSSGKDSNEAMRTLLTNDVSRMFLCMPSLSKGITWDFDDVSQSKNSERGYPSELKKDSSLNLNENTTEGLNFDETFSLGYQSPIETDEEVLEHNNIQQIRESNHTEDLSSSFTWTWSYESSTPTTESEPDENFLTMLKGLDRFVRSTINQQSLYVEANSLYPMMFYDTILVRDFETASKKLEKVCRNVYNTWLEQSCRPVENLLGTKISSEFVQNRLTHLLNDLCNVSAEI